MPAWSRMPLLNASSEQEVGIAGHFKNGICSARFSFRMAEPPGTLQAPHAIILKRDRRVRLRAARNRAMHWSGDLCDKVISGTVLPIVDQPTSSPIASWVLNWGPLNV